MIDLILGDNMDIMPEYDDNHFDLAIVDPPYGILEIGMVFKKPSRPSTHNGKSKYGKKLWDKERPSKEYWRELFRVSKNQIVWGGNYFTDNLPVSKCWVFWDKMFENTFNFSHGELAWTSFDKQILKYTISSKAETRGGKDRIHPTQKPVKLYEWLLKKYAKKGQKILDTHLGSGSIAVACHYFGVDLVGVEIDEEYYNKAKERVEMLTAQESLF